MYGDSVFHVWSTFRHHLTPFFATDEPIAPCEAWLWFQMCKFQIQLGDRYFGTSSSPRCVLSQVTSINNIWFIGLWEWAILTLVVIGVWTGETLCKRGHFIDGLAQERRNSSALAMKLRLSCTNPSLWWKVHVGPIHKDRTMILHFIWIPLNSTTFSSSFKSM